jgi:hypothetical protein
LKRRFQRLFFYFQKQTNNFFFKKNYLYFFFFVCLFVNNNLCFLLRKLNLPFFHWSRLNKKNYRLLRTFKYFPIISVNYQKFSSLIDFFFFFSKCKYYLYKGKLRFFKFLRNGFQSRRRLIIVPQMFLFMSLKKNLKMFKENSKWLIATKIFLFHKMKKKYKNGRFFKPDLSQNFHWWKTKENLTKKKKLSIKQKIISKRVLLLAFIRSQKKFVFFKKVKKFPNPLMNSFVLIFYFIKSIKKKVFGKKYKFLFKLKRVFFNKRNSIIFFFYWIFFFIFNHFIMHKFVHNSNKFNNFLIPDGFIFNSFIASFWKIYFYYFFADLVPDFLYLTNFLTHKYNNIFYFYYSRFFISWNSVYWTAFFSKIK